MSKLDQPLKLKHGLAAAVAIMAMSITGTAIAGGGGGGDGGGGGSNIHYYKNTKRNVQANSQAHVQVRCGRGQRVIGGGVESDSGFALGRGQMINTSAPLDGRDANGRADDGWDAYVDTFDNADDENIRVYAICKE